MTAMELVENYSYNIDASSIVFCVILLLIIRFVLYFSVDKKFRFVKSAIIFVFFGSLSNILFDVVCKTSGNNYLLYFFRAVNHVSFTSCLYLYILYIDDLLGLKDGYVRAVAHFTRLMFVAFMTLDLCSPFTKIGFCYTEEGWKDSIISFYNGFYVYGMLLLGCMLLFYNHRLIKTVRMSLLSTVGIMGIIMVNGAIKNTNTYTSLTYVLPIVVVLITLHSRPIDFRTGAMNYESFAAYVDRYIKLKIPMDFLVLELKTTNASDVSDELGKVLTTFWYKYYANASFFTLEGDCYVLVVPRTEENGDTLAIMNELFYKVFPPYYRTFNLDYKAIGMPDMDFIHTGIDVKHIVKYLLKSVDENSLTIIDDEKKESLKLMQSVKDVLEDIAKKQDLEDERVLVYCQPIKNTKTGIYDTGEALMRLSIPEQNIVSPMVVIPLAEEFGYIHTLTKIMLNKVCKELKALENEGFEYKRVSVNIAASELKEANLCDEIIEIVKSNGVDPSKIGIELTESQNENDYNRAKEKIAALKKAGMTIYLDDYGTGYSNFERVTKLGFDVVKYDRSILMSAQYDGNISDMLRRFAETFKKMDYKILFEGVETNEQAELCSDWGADYLQGFNYSKPIPIKEVRDYFVRH